MILKTKNSPSGLIYVYTLFLEYPNTRKSSLDTHIY